MANLVGVTGGIGAGKSTVLTLLARHGQRTLDSDAVVHRLYEPGSPIAARLLQRWGPTVMEAGGRVNRAAVAERVFRDPEELAWLNRQVHPTVKAEIARQAAAADSLLFCAIPLLFEAGWETAMTCTVAVWCDRQRQRERLQARGWTEAEIQRRENAQLAMDGKLERADFGIVNHGSLDVLERQITRILTRIAHLNPIRS